MKVNAKNNNVCFFKSINAGDVFYSEADPQNYLMRTDHDDWVAVDVETGVLYHLDDFNCGYAQYHIVKAEATIS